MAIASTMSQARFKGARRGSAIGPDANDPWVAASLAVLYGELAMAQSQRSDRAVAYARRAIQNLLKGVPTGEIDEPLLPLKRPSARKSKKSLPRRRRSL